MVNNLNCILGGNTILNNINLSFEKGKFYSIVGPNGSGKTTLLKNILKLIEVDKNTIFIDNKEVTQLKSNELSKLVSYVPQNTNIEFNFSVLDIVMMGRNPYLKRFQSESKNDYEIAEKAMNITQIWDLKDRGINTLSGGERQRVIIARALTQSTDIILLDEPISQLDIHHQINLMNLLKELTEKMNITVITVIHDLNYAIQYSDYLVFLDKGKVFSCGYPEEVITKENLKKVYNMDFHIMKNSLTNKPIILPIL
jgi:iron complex transport system ATP-binding protein